MKKISRNKRSKYGTKEDKMQKLCDELGKAVVESKRAFFNTKNEISGFFYKGKFDELKFGDVHSVESEPKYFSDNVVANNTVGFHTHPNDYNTTLSDEKVIDFPSGGDIKADLYYPIIKKDENLYKNSIQAIIVPSLKHHQVGVFIYRQIFTGNIINLDIVSGYYQIVKLIYLDFDVDKAGEFFRIMDSKKMNDYLKYLEINLLKGDFEKWLHGPLNSSHGTTYWPWKKEHFKTTMFDFKTSKVNIFSDENEKINKVGKRRRRKSRSYKRRKSKIRNMI